ncbi:MAG: hypothetical protein WBJ10_11845, partial [Daejeonella sp.]
MKKTLILFGLLFTGHSIFAQSDIPSAEIQIKTAVLAAPVDKRENATVLGYNENGKLVQLRKGSNEMICIADDPKLPGLSVASYHKDLEPFMKRGRDLRFSGKTAKESIDIRDEEV